MATITTRLPDQVKKDAQQLADDMGVSLSTLVHMWIKDFLRTKKIAVSAVDDAHLEWYTDKDMVEVDEPLEDVLAFMEKHSSGKVSHE